MEKYDLIDIIDRLLSIVFTREFTIIDNRAVISINLTDWVHEYPGTRVQLALEYPSNAN